jgi:hypothetical protein
MPSPPRWRRLEAHRAALLLGGTCPTEPYWKTKPFVMLRADPEMTKMRHILARLLPTFLLGLVLFAPRLGLFRLIQVFGQQNPPASQKVIKDPTEYNAYIAALNTQDPAQRAAAMEAFVTQYPGSVVKTDALEQAMSAYQQAGNQAKLTSTANRILELDPGNVRDGHCYVSESRAGESGRR